jgi:hypothetical protein
MSMPSNRVNAVLPGAVPGTMLINGQQVELRDFTDTHIWDSERMPVGTVITAQQQLNFFSSLSHQLPGVVGIQKLGIETSMTEPSRLPGDWNAIVRNIYFGFMPPIARVDVEAILASAFLQFVIGNQKTEVEGPAMFYPMPYGIAGPLAMFAAVPTEISEFQNGVVAKSAVPNKLPTVLPGAMQFQVRVRFDFPVTIATPTGVRLYVAMPAYISKPVF